MIGLRPILSDSQPKKTHEQAPRSMATVNRRLAVKGSTFSAEVMKTSV